MGRTNTNTKEKQSDTNQCNVEIELDITKQFNLYDLVKHQVA